MKAAVIYEAGGPEVLKIEQVSIAVLRLHSLLPLTINQLSVQFQRLRQAKFLSGLKLLGSIDRNYSHDKVTAQMFLSHAFLELKLLDWSNQRQVVSFRRAMWSPLLWVAWVVALTVGMRSTQ